MRFVVTLKDIILIGILSVGSLIMGGIILKAYIETKIEEHKKNKNK